MPEKRTASWEMDNGAELEIIFYPESDFVIEGGGIRFSIAPNWESDSQAQTFDITDECELKEIYDQIGVMLKLLCEHKGVQIPK